MSPIFEAFQENEEALRRFLNKYRARSSDVDDILQETFLRAFAAEAREEIKAPKAFLFQVAKNVALSEIALKYNSATDLHEDLAQAQVLQDEAQPGADVQLDSRRKLALFAEAVAALPPQCRRVFLMRKFDGMQVKNIAKAMNITVSAVEKLIARGVLKCEDHLRAHGYEPADYGRRAKTPDEAIARIAARTDKSDDG